MGGRKDDRFMVTLGNMSCMNIPKPKAAPPSHFNLKRLNFTIGGKIVQAFFSQKCKKKFTS
jgi:hypothetical protein